ncbi:MAG: aminoglycoside phosphotransferase family protein [bacterium]
MKEVPQKLRIKMDQLLDDKFMKNFLEGNLKTFFEGAMAIKDIRKIVYKEVRGNFDYTLVIEFEMEILFDDRKTKTKSIFCKAHSDERKNKSTLYMELLYKNGFNKGLYHVPRPLTYIPEFRAGFYEGVRGHNLLYFLSQKDHEKIKTIVKDAANWIKKLHDFELKKLDHLKITASKIEDNRPPIKQVFAKMKQKFPQLYENFFPLYVETRKYEAKFLKELNRQEKTKLIYADYHPENVIVPSHSQKGICVIDFTDLALGDPYRDVGTFMEQVEFMARKFMPRDEAKYWKKFFLDEYIRINNLKMTTRDYQRINLYCLWTCLRNIIYFFYKKDPDQVIGALLSDANIYLDKIIKKSKEL